MLGRFAAITLFASVSAVAMAFPNDPDYPGMWQLFSTIPANHAGAVNDWERAHGSGVSADKAWQLHVGTPEALVAVLDSGINWEARDLIDRVALNTAELPLPEGSDTYDKNHDGRVSVSDYAGDSRVHDANGNGVIDAGDLIKIFSDGVDDDHNGYTDDIAGWDFHEHDNDPTDRTRFGHGTGEADDSVAAIDNGIGGTGICGNCSFVPVRVNDSFVVDANSFAEAVVYATNRGAKVVQEALGSTNWSEYTQYAVDYAYDHDVVIIGSAADEDSYHHNYPATLDPVVYTNSLRFDTQNVNDATTFTAFNACSNYGARVDVATPGRFCSSEATGNLSGITALAWSYANSLGRRLTAGELIALLKTSTDDLNFGPNTNDPSRYPSYAGWDGYTGYGRANAFTMLERIQKGDIPPEARIVTPRWFEVRANPETRGDTALQVDVRAATRNPGGVRLKLEVARGIETSSAQWSLVTETPLLPDGLRGSLASISYDLLAGLPLNPRDAARDADAYTLRLTVTDGKGTASESRRTFFYYKDADLAAGFPARLPGSGESAGTFIDLTGDGKDEYVTADGGGNVHAFTASGAELPGFPRATVPSRYGTRGPAAHQIGAAVVAPLAAGDLDGDGKPEIVVVSMEGHVSVIEPDGQQRAGFPLTLPFPDMTQASPDQIIAQGALAAPVLVDLDGDHHKEIVVPGLDGRMYVFKDDGSDFPGFPLEIRAGGKLAKLVSSPAVADLDGDGRPDLIFGSNHAGDAKGYVFAISGHGYTVREPLLPGFPIKIPIIRDVILPLVGTGVPTAPAVADFDGDGRPDILIHPFIGKAYVYDAQGRQKASLSLEVAPGNDTNDNFMMPAFGHPAIGDLTGDGKLSAVTGGAGKKMLVKLALGGKKYDYNHMVGAWDPLTGAMRPGFPRKIEDMMLYVSPLVADLDGDGKGEVIAGSGGYFLHAYKSAGGEIAGFPKMMGGWVFGAASMGDMDGDGRLELAATTREGYLFVWHTQARAEQRAGKGGWLTFKGNPERTGAR